MNVSVRHAYVSAYVDAQGLMVGCVKSVVS